MAYLSVTFCLPLLPSCPPFLTPSLHPSLKVPSCPLPLLHSYDSTMTMKYRSAKTSFICLLVNCKKNLFTKNICRVRIFAFPSAWFLYVLFGLLSMHLVFFLSSVTRYQVVGAPLMILPQFSPFTSVNSSLYNVLASPVCNVVMPVFPRLPFLPWPIHTSMQGVFGHCSCLSIDIFKPLVLSTSTSLFVCSHLVGQCIYFTYNL